MNTNTMTLPIKAKNLSGLGLDSIGDLAGLLQEPKSTSKGGPISMDMDLIDEDPKQPRTEENPGFSVESLGELAETIRLRGVKTPISVRENMDREGRYIINHGHRRYRGSRLADKTYIPAFIDNDYNEGDQVIENLQRDALTPREVADFIGRELAKGIKKKDIAASIGKSAAFVTQHVALLDLPESIAKAFSEERCRDVTVINELVTAHKKKPNEVSEWLTNKDQEITRGSVKLLREYLDDKEASNDGGTDGQDIFSDDLLAGTTSKIKADKDVDPNAFKKAIVLVEFRERPARLMLGKRPSGDGFAWIKYEDDGQEIEAELGEVRLNRLMEG